MLKVVQISSIAMALSLCSALSCSTCEVLSFFGRPPKRPRARAAASPAKVRSLSKFPSNFFQAN